jgi:hypothetical protein
LNTLLFLIVFSKAMAVVGTNVQGVLQVALQYS